MAVAVAAAGRSSVRLSVRIVSTYRTNKDKVKRLAGIVHMHSNAQGGW